MNTSQLAARIEAIQPNLDPVDAARLCLLILNSNPDEAELATEDGLQKIWKKVSFRLQSGTDQYSAVSQELDALGETGPIAFSPDQLWLLLRAVKVQSQMLDMYADPGDSVVV